MPMRNNPPSHGFSFLNRGSFAWSYENGGRVELIIKPNGNSKLYDLSRELLIIARESASPTAKRHIPEIRRERIDIGVGKYGQAVAEIVYSMPEYEAFFSKENEERIEIIIDSDGFPSLQDNLPRGLIEASRRIYNIGRQYGAGTDFRHANFSQSNDGDLIIRDPFYCIQTGYDEIRMSELWPPDQFAIFDRFTRYDSQNK